MLLVRSFSLFGLLLMTSAASAAELPVSYVVASPSSGYESNRVYSGQTVARRTAQLGFNRGGAIEAMRVDIGDRVEADQVLAELDQRSLKANLRRAEADVTVAKANVDVLTARTKLAENTGRRIEKLHGSGHASSQELDEAELAATAMRAELAVAKASLERALANVEVAEVAIAEAFITAPFAGVIQSRHADEGAQVQMAQPVLRLVEDSTMEAHIGVPDTAADELVPGQAYPLITKSNVFNGELLAVLPEVESGSRTQTAVFAIDASDVPIGAVVELEFASRISGDGFWLPVTALTASDRGLWGVFVVNPQEEIERRLVEIIHSESDRAYVRGTLKAGDRVVESGVQRLVPGQKVRSQEISLQRANRSSSLTGALAGRS